MSKLSKLGLSRRAFIRGAGGRSASNVFQGSTQGARRHGATTILDGRSANARIARVSRYSCWVDLLALTVVLGSVSCGGNAQSGPGTGAQGGASDLGSVGGGGAQGGASDLGSAGGVGGVGGVGGAGGQSETTPAPSSISVIVGSDGPLVDPDPVATCLNGFQGFSSSVDGLSIEFEAFISEPGRYEGDPLRILYLSVKMPDGSEYCATGGLVVCLGAITLIARSVGPRFTGELEAELVNRSDAAAPTLSLRLSFDVASRAGCQ